MKPRAAAGQISMFPMPAGGNRKKRTEAEEQAIAMMKEATPEMVEEAKEAFDKYVEQKRKAKERGIRS